MIRPKAAPVRPRIISPSTGDAILLEDYVADAASRSISRSLYLGGPLGCGKTLALCHLEAVIPDQLPTTMLEEPNGIELSIAMKNSFVVYTGPKPLARGMSARIAPWGDDDFIEYLLAIYPDRVNSVFARIQRLPDRSLAGGVAELWRIVIDRMAQDETIQRVSEALLLEVRSVCDELGDPMLAIKYSDWESELESTDTVLVKAFRSVNTIVNRDSRLSRLMQFPSVHTIVDAEWLAESLAARRSTRLMSEIVSLSLVHETVWRVDKSSIVLKFLHELATDVETTPMAASILHATDSNWTPPRDDTRLNGAILHGANWENIELRNTELHNVDLSDANLVVSDLRDMAATKANLERTRFDRSTITESNFFSAQASDAVFCGARISESLFLRTELKGADFSESDISKTKFVEADLRESTFRAASLNDVEFAGSEVEDADFRDARFVDSSLVGLALRLARLEGAVFSNSAMQGCNLEWVRLDGAVFDRCRMSGAHLTGTVLPNADFRDADLCDAGLGEIDWEGADLRGVDFTRCSFHMGSTRCGLVDSPYPSEGTRTGFYTDDYDDQYFKSPEEIRKANLNGANLIGAKTNDVDFYLVDLRNAIYDREQRLHFARTGAILSKAAPLV